MKESEMSINMMSSNTNIIERLSKIMARKYAGMDGWQWSEADKEIYSAFFYRILTALDTIADQQEEAVRRLNARNSYRTEPSVQACPSVPAGHPQQAQGASGNKDKTDGGAL